MTFLRRVVGREARLITHFGGADAYDQQWWGQNGNGVPGPGWSPPVYAGTPVTDTTSVQLSAFYACVRLLADTVAGLPWDSFRNQGASRVKVEPSISLLASPSTEVNVFDWKHVCMVSLAVRGNFFGLVVERDQSGWPTNILPLHPDWVLLVRDVFTGEKRFYINGERVPTGDIFHVRSFAWPGYDLGLSPVSVFRQSIGLGLAAEQFGAKWFRDGAAPSSTLETDKDLTDDQIKQNQQQWISTHGGRRLPAVLSGGFKFKAITITPNESQFLETRKFQVAEIARMFGIPPHMVGDVDRSTSWGTGIEQMSVGFVTYTLAPWLGRIEAALNQITPRGQFVKFNVQGLLRGDIQTRYDAYQKAIDGSWMCPDEVRALEDLPPIPDGKGAQFRQPLNFGPLGTVPPTPPAAPVSRRDLRMSQELSDDLPPDLR